MALRCDHPTCGLHSGKVFWPPDRCHRSDLIWGCLWTPDTTLNINPATFSSDVSYPRRGTGEKASLPTEGEMKAAEKTDGKPPQQTTGEDGKEVDGWSKEKQLEVVRKAIEESHNGTGFTFTGQTRIC